MECRYQHMGSLLNRLKEDYLKHGSLFIMFDFDDTVYPYSNKEDTCNKVIATLKRCNKAGFKLILFTARERENGLEFAEQYLKELGIEYLYTNCNPEGDIKLGGVTRKPYCNLLLDDKAGLGHALEALIILLSEIDKGKIKYDNNFRKS